MTIAQRRLYNQHLVGRKFDTPSDAVAWLGAVQAQDYLAAKWALGQRTQNATARTIEQALNDGHVLRTHILRPTWHFVRPADIRWLLQLTAPRVLTALASSNRKLALDDAMFARSNELIARALRGGNQLTRQELKAVLERAGIHTDVQRLAHLVMRAELDALICSGPRRGQQFTYALLEERVPKAKNLSRDEALAALTLRYFLSHGPAQLTDFTWWSGLTMNDAKAGIEMVRSELVEETLHDLSYWSSPPKRVTARKGPRAFLLSLYDEFTIAYKDRSALGEGRYTERLLARGNALTSVLLLDGQIAGTWRRVLKGGRVEITVKPFMRLGRGGKEVIAAEAHRYGKFLEIPVTVSLAR